VKEDISINSSPSTKSQSQNSLVSTAHDLSETESAASVEELIDELQQTKRPFADWQILSFEIKQGIAKRGYIMPTPVQTVTIEPAIAGQDLVVQAKTGTGKTAAFGIPILEQIKDRKTKPQAMILTPTRELAAQVAEELTDLAINKNLSILAVYGGISIGDQIDALEKGVDLIVGTPGRVLDHIKRKTLLTDDIEMIVLDEADEMLSMGFYIEVSTIIEHCKRRRQLMLFSATIPPDIEGLIRQYTNKPMRFMISGSDRRVTGIGHIAYFVNEDIPRPRNLLYILEYEAPESAIIFCNRRDDTSMIAAYLVRQGKNSEGIHGEMNQSEREQALKNLKQGKIQYLVATDIAARGIDISALSHVINYNFPPSMDSYIHRVGRTGRLGQQGIAISMVAGDDLTRLVQLKQIHKIFFELKYLPPTTEVVQLAAARHIKQLFDESFLHVIEPYLPIADAIQLDPRGRFIFAHLLKMYYEGKLEPAQSSLQQAQKTLELYEQDEAEPEEASPNKTPNNAPDTSAILVETPEDVDNSPNGDQEFGLENSEDVRNNSPNGDQELGLENSEDVRIYISAGSVEGYQSDTLRQMICEEAGVDGRKLGAVQIERHHSFLNTDSETTEKILAAFQERKVGEFSISAEVARRQRRRKRR
jgi:ATP-dependent RNA helicase DeaD